MLQSQTTPASPLRLRPLTSVVGVEVHDVDLNRIGPDEMPEIMRIFTQHSALLFRRQKLDAAALVRFSQLFGDLDEAPINETGKTAVDGYPEVYVVSNIKDEQGAAIGSLGAGEAAWHTDMSYLDNPPRASLLYGVEIPPTGGNTWLASMTVALAEMPLSLRKRVEGRRIKHDGTFNSAGLLRQGVEVTSDLSAAPGALHPAICRHPDDGRELLFLGRRRNAYVEGLTAEESDALLDELWAHSTQARFTYAHIWEVGDVLMWDNRATLHRRDPFDASARRYMLRTQVKGTAAPAAAAQSGE